MTQQRMGSRAPLGALVIALLAALIVSAPAWAQDQPPAVPPVVAPVVPPADAPVVAPVDAPADAGSPFDGNAMWIWQLPKANGGDWEAIAQQAKATNVTALFIKSADGPVNDWRQFTPEMVDYFHSQGLKVCGWHYVYGRRPGAEARLSANAMKDGADCFIIDAEAEYEGRYAAADEYMTKLRALVGDDAPIALAAFPYVDFHPSFPYSVFMRPKGGAEYNLPQMYWRAIGTSVDEAFRHTYRWNVPYDRPIFPLGQIWQSPSVSEIKRFRQLASAYGAPGVSWWEWSQGPASVFRATGRVVAGNVTARSENPVTIRRGSSGDWVVWAQEHLNGAGQAVKVTGNFGPQTQLAITAFQTAEGLPVSGTLDPATWTALVEAEPVSTPWARRARGARSASAASVGAGAPASARLPSKRNELAGKRE